MKITLILCTYNRDQSLAKALDSVLASRLPESVEWEILVVDNNSSDQTREVVKRYCCQHPGRLRYMFVPQQGKSYALNAALQETRADVVAFTDDDVTVDPGWLRNLTAPLEDSQWAGCAGRIRLGQDFLPPRWLAVSGAFNLGGSLVQFDEGDNEGELTRAPFGANMAFRKSMFEKYGNFRTDLGRNGRSLIGNEDTEFGKRLLAAGERLCFVPSAVVNHPVSPERLTKRYFRAYWFSLGRSDARQAGNRLPLWRIPLRYLRQLKRKLQWMSAMSRRWFLDPQGRFFCETLLCYTAGEILEAWRKRNKMRMIEAPSFMFVHVNQRCNLRCQHCIFWKQNDSDRTNYLSWPRKAEILREFAELSPDGAVVICGGESMLDLDDYFAITTECRSLAIRSISVINGTRVQHSAIADRMIVEGPNEISVSLNSHLESTHDRTRGVAGSFNKAVTALRLLLEARERRREQKTRIYVMGLIYDENYRELDAFYDFVLNDIKADKLKLNFLQPSFGWDQPIDPFFAQHHKMDLDLLVDTIRKCDQKYKLNLNPIWLQQVGMYFRSLKAASDVHLGWGAKSGTAEHICNTYKRNIMVDLYGNASLCFSTLFPRFRLSKFGDLRHFWESADHIRGEMMQCNRFCGISHSVRRESSTLFPNRPKRSYAAA